MRRWPILIASSMIFFAPLAFGQSSSNDQMFSSDLVMWSHMQQPRQPEPGQMQQPPTPEPSPETPPEANPTAKPQQGSSSASAESQTADAQSFTGTISKDADGFILHVSQSVSYKLDSQQQVQQYEGRRVRVTGTLDSSINLIHVEKVEPLS